MATSSGPSRPRWRLRNLALLLIVSLLIAACTSGEDAGSTTTSEAGSGGEATTSTTSQGGEQPTTSSAAETSAGPLTVAVGTFLTEDVVPYLMSGATMAYSGGLYDFLVGADQTGAVTSENGIADSWETTDGGLTWSFVLKDGIAFHNGDPLTAEDVKFSLELLATEEATSSSAATFQGNLASVTVESPTELTVAFSSPVVELPQILSSGGGLGEGAIIPKDYFESVGLEGFRENPIGSGPWEFASRTIGSDIRFTANEDYWGQRPGFDELVLLLVSEPATRIAMLETGDADIIEVPKASIPEVEGTYGIKTIPYVNGIGFQIYYAGTVDSTVDDVAVREALNLAIDRDLINDSLFRGLGTPTSQYPFTPGLVGYDPSLAEYPYDPERAVELLAEAGQEGLEVDLWVMDFPGLSESRNLATAVAGFWTDIGVTVNLLPTEFGTFRGKYVADPQDFSSPGGDISIFTSSRLASALATSQIYLITNGILKLGLPEGETIDALHAQAATEVDASARQELLQEISALTYDSYLTVPIVSVGVEYAIGERVSLDSWQPVDGTTAAPRYNTAVPSG